LLAGCSLKQCPWAKALYQKHRSRGKRHHEALRIIAKKWAKIIFAMCKNNTLYDEERFLAARKRCPANCSLAKNPALSLFIRGHIQRKQKGSAQQVRRAPQSHTKSIPRDRRRSICPVSHAQQKDPKESNRNC